MDIRDLQHNEFEKYWAKNRVFSQFEAMLDLVFLMSDKDSEQVIYGQVYEFKAGQRPLSNPLLQKRWNWSRQQVRTFLDKLEKDGVIKREQPHSNHTLTTFTYLKSDYYKGEQPNTNHTLTTPEPKKTTRKKRDYTYIDSIISLWQRMYLESREIEYDVTTRGKDRAAVSKLIQMNKKANPDATTESSMKNFEYVFQISLAINGKKHEWLHEGMSLPLLVSQWNTIKSIHNETNRRNNTQSTREEKRDFLERIGDHFDKIKSAES